MRIALTGGIACGKSLTAKFFRELGVRVLDADDVVHELEAPGGMAVPAIVARFGPSVLAPDGGIDRKRLADVVFTGTPCSRVAADGSAARGARDDLEAILHPIVRTRLREFVENAAGGELRLAIIPLLFESHFESDYDIILCVSSTEDRQIDRMMHVRSYTREQAEARLAAQMSVAEKAARANWTIHNNSTPDDLRAEVCRCVAWLSARMEKIDEHRRKG